MKKLEVGKTYKYTDDERYIKVLKHLAKYEVYLCDIAYLNTKAPLVCRTTIEYDCLFLWEETEDDFEEKISDVPDYLRSHALKRNK